MAQEYEIIIGLEVHLRLNTASKMFCGTVNSDSSEPNVYTCPVCLGHPGTLPQVNEEAIDLGTKLALALNADVQEFMKFDRKNYFYPDLPKGYQISQYDKPLALNGYLDVLLGDIETKRINLERLHLEEDAAKLKHDKQGNSLVDFNRAGTPLVELVTKPSIRSAMEAKTFAQELQLIARYTKASDADMEKGHMRCDANISLRPKGSEVLYPKTEVKNMNSFRSIQRALEYEIERQTRLWEINEAPEITTTRGWDDKKGITVKQRTKEDEADYRYFPEPDIPPIVRTKEEIEKLKRYLPELPYARRIRFRDEYSINYVDAKVLTTDPQVGEFYEQVISELRGWLQSSGDNEGTAAEIWEKNGSKMSKLAVAWILTEVFGLLKEQKKNFADNKFTAENFAELLTMIFTKQINSSAAQKILKIMFINGGDPSIIMEEHDLVQVSDEGAIEEIVNKILAENVEVVEDYKNGKDKALMFLVGQVMKETKGKINPEMATNILKEKINL